MSEVAKFGYLMPVSHELLREAQATASGIRRWMNASPEERREWARDARQNREEQRAAAEPVPLTLDGLLDRMGWTRAYAEHLVQSYCECGDDIDGWAPCQHAQDVGLAG